MFGIRPWDLIVILAVIFILFGHRLPSVMRMLGHSLVEFRHDPNTLRATSLADWLVIVMLVGLLFVMLLWSTVVVRVGR